MSRPTYRVTVTREDGYWVAVVDGLRGGATETRRLDRIEDQVRELVAWLADAREDSFQLAWQYELPRPLADLLQALHEKRDTLKRAKDEYEAATRDAVAEARSESISVRDTGALLGLSYQRIQQLDAEIKGTRKAAARRAVRTQKSGPRTRKVASRRDDATGYPASA
jgi:hypothetical protein